MSERITKSAILREARRVYGDVENGPNYYESDRGSYMASRGCRYACEIWYGLSIAVLAAGASRAEARRMALAALKAAGDAR